jgi:hypothetical protein
MIMNNFLTLLTGLVKLSYTKIMGNINEEEIIVKNNNLEEIIVNIERKKRFKAYVSMVLIIKVSMFVNPKKSREISKSFPEDSL